MVLTILLCSLVASLLGWRISGVKAHAGAGHEELGQVIEGAGRANYDWFKHAGYKYGVAFRAEKSGTIRGIGIPWRTTPPGYGHGSYGIYTAELHGNGAHNFPDDNMLARYPNFHPTDLMDSHDDYPLTVPLHATLVAGQLYHLVFYNTDPDREDNWSSANTMMTRLTPWDTWAQSGSGGRGETYHDGRWTPWSSKYDPWNKSGANDLNGSYMAVIITWADGSISGNGYWSAAMDDPALFWGAARAGEYMAWDQPRRVITTLGLSVARQGHPAGPLQFHLEEIGVGELATGVLTTAKAVSTVAEWQYVTLPQPITFDQGHVYRLWFDSPQSRDKHNCYLQHPVYAPGDPSAWLHATWGGTASHYIAGIGAGWESYSTHDLSFSLQ
jgi:hypothetical protein